MTFMVILIGLVIERFFDWSHLRHWRWYKKYETWVMRRFKKRSSYSTLAMIIVPLLVVVFLLQFLLSGVLYGFASLVFGIIIFIYCLGPKDLWADAFACSTALDQQDPQAVADKIKQSFGIESNRSQTLHKHLLSSLFTEANCRVFAIVFWYLLLGAPGAVLYRAITFSADENAPQTDSGVVYTARFVESILNWLPIRLFTFLLALGGHFSQVFAVWSKNVLRGFEANEVLLTECGQAALGDAEHVATDGSAERTAIKLLDRAFVIMLVIVLIVELLF